MSEEDVKRGHEEAMALFKTVTCMTSEARRECFGDWYTPVNVIKTFSYDGIQQKIDAWKERKERENAVIHVKDEVQHKTCKYKCVVLKIYKDDYGYQRINAITTDKYFVADCLASEYEKTGVHVDDLDAYLGV